MTPARIKGELSDITEAYTKELDAMLGKSPGACATRGDNTAGKRVKDATLAYKEAKGSGIGLTTVTNTLSDDMDKLLVEAANRAMWGQRQTASRKAGWSPTMAKHTAILKFPSKSKNWRIRCLRTKLSELPHEQQNELPSPWESSSALGGKGSAMGVAQGKPRGGEESPESSERGLEETRPHLHQQQHHSQGTRPPTR